MAYRITASNRLTRTLRRTAVTGAGLAMILGVAVPAAAASPTKTNPSNPMAAAMAIKTGPLHSAPIRQAPLKVLAAQASAKAAHRTPARDKVPATTLAAKSSAITAVPAKALAKPAAPAAKQLMPLGTPHGQVSIKPNATQLKNATEIVKTGEALKLPPRAWVIAVATSLQETHLHNYGNLGGHNDHDSLGLFQQRPSSGWGKANDLVKPDYAASKFYKALVKVKNWDKLPLTAAAQKVQVSAFGDRYAKWEVQAANLVTHCVGH